MFADRPFPLVEMAVYLNFCRGLRFDNRPDYSYLRNLFRSLFHREGYTYDCVFDWNLLKFNGNEQQQQQQQTNSNMLTNESATAGVIHQAQPNQTRRGQQQQSQQQQQQHQHHHHHEEKSKSNSVISLFAHCFFRKLISFNH